MLYRMKLVPGLEKIITNLKHEEDVLGTVLSGAGPSILIVSKGSSQDKIKSIVRETWADLNVKVDIFDTTIEKQGAIIVSNEEAKV